jgi:hypothetical protein
VKIKTVKMKVIINHRLATSPISISKEIWDNEKDRQVYLDQGWYKVEDVEKLDRVNNRRVSIKKTEDKDKNLGE